MAANYWDNKWAKCVASKQRLMDSQLDDRARGLTEDQIQQIRCHFSFSINELVKAYKSAFKVELRQRVAATACVYFRRFYLKNCFCHVDPRLVFVGCVYLASKAEESVLPAKHLVTFMRKYRPGWSYEMKHLLDIEMVIMEDLNFDLVVFSPYRSLAAQLRDCALGEAVGLRAWSLLNDSYRTDVSLLYPPYMVALACVQLAVVHLAQQEELADRVCHGRNTVAQEMSPPAASARGGDLLQAPATAASNVMQRMSSWMETLDVDLDQVYEIVVDITDMFEKFCNTLSNDECGKLLDAVQGLPSQGQALLTQVQHGNTGRR